MNATAQKSYISTSIGKIAVYINEHTSKETPIIFLHGIYFDHHLWDRQIEKITDRTVIAVDMPLHGESREKISRNWTLNDCANMLIEILDTLQIPKVIAVGHSWGSMTILRAVHKQPNRFASVGLCNMTFEPASNKQKITLFFQHSMVGLRNFYTGQTANTMFGKSFLKENPGLLQELKRPMDILSNKQIKQVDKRVMLDAEDTTLLIESLKVKAIALKGEEDFASTPPKIETRIVKGIHVSPLEEPLEVHKLIMRLIDIA